MTAPVTSAQTRKRDLRGRNMDKLTAILQSLSLDLAGPVRWADARALVMRTPEWHRDGELQRIELVDMLAVFEDEVRRAEHEAQGARQKAAEDKRRRARKARDDFNVRPLACFLSLFSSRVPARTRELTYRLAPLAQALLQELVATGDLVAGSQWSQIYPLVSRDVRYLSLLGQPGSTPLDLFWDRVDELDVEAEEQMLFLDEVARAKGVVVGEETAEDEFVKALEGDERVDKMGKDAVKKAFERVRPGFRDRSHTHQESLLLHVLMASSHRTRSYTSAPSAPRKTPAGAPTRPCASRSTTCGTSSRSSTTRPSTSSATRSRLSPRAQTCRAPTIGRRSRGTTRHAGVRGTSLSSAQRCGISPSLATLRTNVSMRQVKRSDEAGTSGR